MSELYLKWMDRLYLFAMGVAGVSLLVMTIVIPIGIFSRYVLNRGESWPEPIAIICMVTFTFIGAAVAYRSADEGKRHHADNGDRFRTGFAAIEQVA